MPIRWSLPAVEDLERISKYIERNDPDAAHRVTRVIYEGCGRLESFPSSGRRSTRLPGRRELIFAPLPYIAIYRVAEGAVEILRVYHGAQDWP